MFMYRVRGADSSGGFFGCLASKEEIKERRKKRKKINVAACLMALKRRDEDPDNPDSNSLHDLSMVGIDTCSAVSVSTELEDFLFVDRSEEARDSVTLRGVGGMNSAIGGGGPMVVRAQDKDRDDIVVFDPSGVYLDQAEEETQARFRIFGQVKLKEARLKLVQDKYGDDEDYLVYRGGEMEIPLEINNDIVTLKTSTLSLTDEQRITLEEHIESILGTGDERQAFVKMGNCPSFIFNQANLTREQIARLTHWRQAHQQCGDGEIHENCPVCEEGTRKTKGFKKNGQYRDEVTSNNKPYHRLYADGYGGQQSFGWQQCLKLRSYLCHLEHHKKWHVRNLPSEPSAKCPGACWQELHTCLEAHGIV